MFLPCLTKINMLTVVTGMCRDICWSLVVCFLYNTCLSGAHFIQRDK